MRSEFPVTNLLTPDEFIKLLKSRSFCLYEDDLEWCDKEGLIRPVLRLKRPKLNPKEFPYSRYRYMETNMYAIQYYYTIDLVEFPVDGDFQRWSEYIKEEEDICVYYHPYQILQIDTIVQDLQATKVLDLHNIMNPPKSNYDISTNIRKLNRVREEQIKTWIQRVGLLILLEDYYGRWFSRNIPLNIYDMLTRSQRITKLKEWAKKFSPTRTLLLSNMCIKQIEEFYRSLSIRASQLDPLSDWFILQRIIKKSRRYDLRDKALLAQDYYGYLSMLTGFIFDLSGKNMPEPDDIISYDSGKWKNRVFGDPFDYASKKTQNQILKYFLIDRPIELVIIVEGETEERVIELILEARTCFHNPLIPIMLHYAIFLPHALT